MDLYTRIMNHMLFPLYEGRLRGRRTLMHLRSLQRTQWCSTDELVAMQGEALRRLLSHAFAHVPFYREQLRARGISPGDIRSVADLPLLPLLGRDEARATTAPRTSTAPPYPTVRKITGGTTGQPLTFAYERGSEDWRNAVKLRGWGWAGYRVGAPTYYYWGLANAQPPGPVRRAKIAIDHRLKRERYEDCTIRGPAELRRAAQGLAAARPRFLIGYTQALVDLARAVLAGGWRAWPDLTTLCCAERLFPDDRAQLAAAFGPAVYETYGCREVMLIGTECEHHDGLHESMENLVVELIVREPGGALRPARPGEVGEVVVTDLHNLSMPFIRYATGDLAVRGPATPCACGRGLKRLASVEGRVAETVRLPDGTQACGIFFSRIFSTSEALAREVDHWQAVQRADGSLVLRLALKRPLSPRAETDLYGNLRATLRGLRYCTEIVPAILPGKNGKRRTVISEL